MAEGFNLNTAKKTEPLSDDEAKFLTLLRLCRATRERPATRHAIYEKGLADLTPAERLLVRPPRGRGQHAPDIGNYITKDRLPVLAADLQHRYGCQEDPTPYVESITLAGRAETARRGNKKGYFISNCYIVQPIEARLALTVIAWHDAIRDSPARPNLKTLDDLLDELLSFLADAENISEVCTELTAVPRYKLLHTLESLRGNRYLKWDKAVDSYFFESNPKLKNGLNYLLKLAVLPLSTPDIVSPTELTEASTRVTASMRLGGPSIVTRRPFAISTGEDLTSGQLIRIFEYATDYRSRSNFLEALAVALPRFPQLADFFMLDTLLRIALKDPYVRYEGNPALLAIIRLRPDLLDDRILRGLERLARLDRGRWSHPILIEVLKVQPAFLNTSLVETIMDNLILLYGLKALFEPERNLFSLIVQERPQSVITILMRMQTEPRHLVAVQGVLSFLLEDSKSYSDCKESIISLIKAGLTDKNQEIEVIALKNLKSVLQVHPEWADITLVMTLLEKSDPEEWPRLALVDVFRSILILHPEWAEMIWDQHPRVVIAPESAQWFSDLVDLTYDKLPSLFTDEELLAYLMAVASFGALREPAVQKPWHRILSKNSNLSQLALKKALSWLTALEDQAFLCYGFYLTALVVEGHPDWVDHDTIAFVSRPVDSLKLNLDMIRPARLRALQAINRARPDLVVVEPNDELDIITGILKEQSD